MLPLLIFVLFLENFNTNVVSNTNRLHQFRRKSLISLIFLKNDNLISNDKTPSCQWVQNSKHQSKLCWRQKGLPEVLQWTRNLSTTNCQENFRYDQWNCSVKDFFFTKIYRETAFMYSITSSALMYAIAKSCSSGKLAGCKCAAHGKQPNTTKWQWGGCGDNIKYAKAYTRKFLQLKKHSDDLYNKILKYNMETGLQIVAQNEKKICRCHGVSGSCSVKICFKRIRPFKIISQQLKNLYHNALQIIETNAVTKNEKFSKTRRLLYLTESPNFCLNTTNRICINTDNCATLCCGRGFFTGILQTVEECNCRWRNKEIFQIECEKCYNNATIFKCK